MKEQMIAFILFNENGKFKM